MKFFSLFIIQFSSVLVFSQAPQAIDSVNINEWQNVIQKNVGKKYPYYTHRSLAGKKYYQKELYGKVTLINFWFEYCSPCIAEFDALNRLYQKYKINKKFQFISFSTDAPARAKAVVKKYQLNFPVLCISEKECGRLNYNSGFPTSILINPDGKVCFIKIGGSMENKIIELNLKEIEAEIIKCL